MSRVYLKSGKTFGIFVLLTFGCFFANADKSDVLEGVDKPLKEKETEALDKQLSTVNNKLKEDLHLRDKLAKRSQGDSISSRVSKYNSVGDINILNSFKSDPNAILAVIKSIKFRGSNEELNWIFSIIKNSSIDDDYRQSAILAVPRICKSIGIRKRATTLLLDYSRKFDDEAPFDLERKSVFVALAEIGTGEAYLAIKKFYSSVEDVQSRYIIFSLLSNHNMDFLDKLKIDLETDHPNLQDELTKFSPPVFQVTPKDQ